MPESVSGSAETPKRQFWESLDVTRLVVYSIGAFHGLLTIFFVRQVVALEASQRKHKRMQEYVRLNRFIDATCGMSASFAPGRR